LIDLIQKLLKKDPGERISAKLSWQHPWIQRKVKEENKNLVIDASVFSELERFMKS